MDNNYIIGLDDICINDKIIFDCKCVSTDGADVYEFDFAKYKKALKDYNLIYKNNIEYVNSRRENFIKILFEQRNSLVVFEYIKLKEEDVRNKQLNEINTSKKNNILDTVMKDVKYNKNTLNTLIKDKNKKKIKIKTNGISNNANSIENKKFRKSSHELIIKRMPSMSTLFKDKKNKMILNEPDNNTNNKILTINNFYPMIKSEKRLSLINFTKININKLLEKENIEEIKNKRKKLNKLKLKGNNKLKLDFTDTNLIYNDNNKILKSLNIYINNSTSIEKRSQRNIVPMSTKYKLSLNKTKLNKNKEYKIPSIFKECSKDFSSFKSKLSKEIFWK